MVIDNVVVEADETVFSKKELKNYVDYAKAHSDGTQKKNEVHQFVKTIFTSQIS